MKDSRVKTEDIFLHVLLLECSSEHNLLIINLKKIIKNKLTYNNKFTKKKKLTYNHKLLTKSNSPDTIYIKPIDDF